MLPAKIKLVREDDVLKLVDEEDEEIEFARFSEESSLTEAEGRDFLKTVVRLWNDHNND